MHRDYDVTVTTVGGKYGTSALFVRWDNRRNTRTVIDAAKRYHPTSASAERLERLIACSNHRSPSIHISNETVCVAVTFLAGQNV